MLKLNDLNHSLLMTKEEGLDWHKFKATLGPIYPGYESFDTYMKWVQKKLLEFGCVDVLEHHWTHQTYRVKDWPEREPGVLKLVIEGKEIPVGTYVRLAPSTGKDGLTAPMVYYDSAQGEPEVGAFEGKIVVMEELPFPGKPYDDDFLDSYVIADTNYRSDPEPPANLLELPSSTVSNSWFTRWAFGCWMSHLVPYAAKGKAAGLIIVSRLTYGALHGLYERQREHVTGLVVDRLAGKDVLPAAKVGKTATMTLVSEFFPADAWNFVCYLPGADYGTDRDQQISINVHVDAMSLTQDNGSLGLLGIVRYFSQLPQAQRPKTLLLCVDCRHFIEGFEAGNMEHDPYVVYPEIRKKVVACLGLEHMGEMEGAEDLETNTMYPTGRPEYSFVVTDDNDYCAHLLIRSAIDSKLKRADVRVDGRPGIHGLHKSWIRAAQARTHKLGICVFGQAGNWCGAHTQIYSTLQYFGDEKFAAEVAMWTEVVNGLMHTDPQVYDVAWSNLNTAIRAAAKNGQITETSKEGLLMGVASIFRDAEDGEYELAAQRLEKEVIPAAKYLSVQTVADAAQATATMLRSQP